MESMQRSAQSRNPIVKASTVATPTSAEAIAPAAVARFQYIPKRMGTTKTAMPEKANRLISKMLPGWNTPKRITITPMITVTTLDIFITVSSVAFLLMIFW